MTGKRIVSYILAVIMLVSTCTIPVSAENAIHENLQTTDTERNTAKIRQKAWGEQGRNNKTTLFIGDSYFDSFWADFDEIYAGKDALKSGISNTTTMDWNTFIEEELFLVNTAPANIVVHLGHNDIHHLYNHTDATLDEICTDTTANLQALLEKIYNTTNAKIYFFGITHKANWMYDGAPYPSELKQTVDDVNANISNWCVGKNWITYIDPVDTVEGFDASIESNQPTGSRDYEQTTTGSWYQDNTHLSKKGYHAMVDLLAATGIVICNEPEAAGDVTCVTGDANYDSTFDVADLVRLKRHLNTTELECSMDGDLNVSGTLNDPDAVRCREMLVGDPALQVTATEDSWYKRLVTEENCYAYYEIKKAVKAGRMITFDIIFPEDADYTAYVYYDGCKDWTAVKDADTTAEHLQCKIITPKDIDNVRVKVVNNASTEVVSDYTIYNIQVVKDSTLLQKESIDMTLTYDGSTAPIVLYGAGATLDMTKFAVETETEGFTYTWDVDSNVLVDSDMASREYAFAKEQTYKLNATETITGTKSSMTIYVLPKPAVNIDYSDGEVENTGTNSVVTVGTYTIPAQNDDSVLPIQPLTTYATKAVQTASSDDSFVETTTTSYVAGVDGTERSALSTNHKSGAYTVVKNYPFKTNNFVVSAWIKVPSGVSLSTDASSYLFGTMNPDGTSGFALSLQEQKLRIKVNDNEAVTKNITFEKGAWYNVVVQRSGTTLRVLFDGNTVTTFTLNSTDSFGVTDLAFGAYTGWEKAYMNYSMFYDNIMIIANGLNLDKAKALANVRSIEPEVRVDYDDSTVTNTGLNQSILADSYNMDAQQNATAFVETTDVSYVSGVNGTSDKAMTVNHMTGPYTVVNDYVFDTRDFTTSVWFNLKDASKLGNNSRHFLIGTVNPDSGVGFNACLKKNGSEYQIRLRGAQKTVDFFTIPEDIKSNTWYHLALSRVGNTMYVYFNGESIGEYTVDSYNFNKKDLAVGGYIEFKNDKYEDSITYFDELEIYGAGLSASQIKDMYSSKNPALNVAVDFTGGTVVNTGKSSDLVLGTYKFNNKSNPDYFKAMAATYTAGVAGDDKGAISINHHDGAYVSVQDYALGTDNFSASTWFYVPSSEKVGTSGTYLIGNSHPNASEGFNVCLKYSASAGYELRVNVDGDRKMYGFSADKVEFASDTWYYLTVVREGANFKIYVNGQLFATKAAQVTTDLGIADLALGAYPGFGEPYTSGTRTYFDGLKVYSGAITSGKIAADMAADEPIEQNGTTPPSGTETPPVGEEGTWQ